MSRLKHLAGLAEPRSPQTSRLLQPRLTFSPTAWAKLLFLRDYGPTEVGGFGISPPNEPLHVEEFQLVRQACTPTSVEFADEAVADFFDQQVDTGRRPEQFARLWIHTHPGNSAEPSPLDEETFTRVFDACAWSLMFILARGGETYARLQFGVGPGGSLRIPVKVDYTLPFEGSDRETWEEEYWESVQVMTETPDSCDDWPDVFSPWEKETNFLL